MSLRGLNLLAALCFVALGPACAQERIIWQTPQNIPALNFAGDVGTGAPAPKPPFTFQKEDLNGTQPKLSVRDANGTEWNVKFGNEVKPECFAWRLPRAVGYFVEPSFYVRSGQIQKLTPLQRKSPSLGPNGVFRDARFQYRDPKIRFLPGQSWWWKRNPFAGSKELKGLEILIMLASNWDNKDATSGPASNTAVFEDLRSSSRKLLYAFTDWGSGMGRWGDATGQTDWNCADYTAQSQQFVQGVSHSAILFGYEGHHKSDFQSGIRGADVAWLLVYLSQVSDSQLRDGLRASGANATEEACFVKAIRARIDALVRVSH